jgi:hypothetical protein
VHDLEIKDADLVAATHGRGFWVLDDISPLRQYDEKLTQKSAHLFNPEDHTRFGYHWWMDYGGGPPSEEKYFFVRNAEAGYTFYERGMINGERKREFIDAGEARPMGVLIYYLLREDAKDIELSILDEDGKVVRTFTQDEIPTQRYLSFDNRGYEKDLVTGEPAASVSTGLNRFSWDMRYPKVSGIPGVPPVVVNPIAKPGTYQVRLTVDGESQTGSFELKLNPNETYTREETGTKAEAWMALYAKTEQAIQMILKAQDAQEKAKAVLEGSASSEAKAAANTVDQMATDFIAGMVATGRTLVQIISEPTKPLSKLVTLHNIMEHTEGPPNGPWLQVYDKTAAEIDAALANFDESLAAEMKKMD